MPQSLFGPGGTAFERMSQAVLDKISPGTSSLPSGTLTQTSVAATFDQFVEENIFHPSGHQLTMTGFTTVGVDDHVTGA